MKPSPAQAFGAQVRAQSLRVPPNDEGAERAVLGAVLLGGKPAFDRARELLSGSDFYRSAHQLLWGVLEGLDREGSSLDHVTIRDAVCRNGSEARIGGEAYLAELARDVPSDSAVADYARIVKDHALARYVISASQTLVGLAYDPATLSRLPAVVSEHIEQLRVGLAEVPGTETKGDALPSAAELLVRELEPREWLVHGFLQQAKTGILFGASYAGKSVLSIQLGLALARGDHSFLGFALPGHAVEVAYFMGENDEHELRDILAAQCGDGTPPPTFRYCDVFARPDRRSLASAEGLAWYRATLARNGTKVAIVDNLMSLVGADLKETEVAVSVMEGLKRTSKETGVSWILLGHTRKEGAKGDEGSLLDKLYGAHEWGSYTDSALFVGYPKGSDRDETRREVRSAKVRGAVPRQILVDFRRETMSASFVADLDKRKAPLAIEPEEALAYVREHGPVVTLTDLMEGLGISRATAYRLVGSIQWRKWTEDGTLQVTAKSQRGAPTAFKAAQ